MKNVLLITLMAILYSCVSDDRNQVATNIDIGIEFFVFSEEGIDLLNPESPNAFRENEIRIFNLIDGIVTEVYNPRMDLPRGFALSEPEPLVSREYYSLGLGANTYSTDEYPITYIQWNENDTDTLKVELDKGDNYEMVTKVWFNDQLVWNLLSDGDLRQFEIVK